MSSARYRPRILALVLMPLLLAAIRVRAEESGPPNPRAEALIRVCKACHTIDKDGEDMLGPNLWNAYGAKAASKADFPYSTALRNAGISWTEESLAHWLESPAKFIPGSKMAYPGVPDAAERQTLIAYLKSLTCLLYTSDAADE